MICRLCSFNINANVYSRLQSIFSYIYLYDLLKNIDVKSITKNEYDNNSMHDIYNNAVSKVINNIKQDQIDNITGKKYMVNDESNTVPSSNLPV